MAQIVPCIEVTRRVDPASGIRTAGSENFLECNTRRAEMNNQERIEVRRWVEDAITLFEEAGKETALTEIADSKGRFVVGEHYIFALNLSGTMLAHPIEPELNGNNLMDLRDSEGKPFIRRIVDTAKTKGYGFTDYMWRSPGSDDELHKTVFFERVDGTIVCSGFYSSREGFLDSIFKCFQFYGPC
jgi:cytochrome c